MKRNLIKAILIMSILAWAVCVLYVLTAPVEAEAIVEEDDHIPGDDALALVRCYMTDEEVQEAYENYYIEQALIAKAHKIENCTVTHYDCCVLCCGKTDSVTASGLQATPGVTVGVDPDVIPLGSDVLVDYGDGEIHYYRADDAGGAVKGNHIDLCVASHDEALQLGRRTTTVYWVAQEEVSSDDA